ncbi:MAG: hypothetical protein EOM01_05745 [Spirochaetia bacterium]|nr:hypothetical protein [Spirochaetia bacterium]
MSELITQAEFARRVGVDRSQVTLAVKSGRIKKAKGTNLIDFDTESKKWESNRSDSLAGTGTANITRKSVPNIGRKRSVPSVTEVETLDIDKPSYDDMDDDDDDSTLTAQKVRKLKADAERVELKLAQEKGDLISKDDVLNVYFTFLVAIKNSITAAPDRIVGEIQAALTAFRDEPDMLNTRVYEILKAEHNAILDEVKVRLSTAKEEAEKIAKAQMKKGPRK